MNKRFCSHFFSGLRTSGALSFLFAVCAISLFAHSTPLDAAWTRTHASACMVVNSGTGLHPLDSAYEIWNDSTVKWMTLLCDISDTNVFPKTAIKTVNIHGKDGNATYNVDAKACRSNWATVGGACSAVVSSTTGTPDFTLSPSPSIWTGRGADFGYLWVNLPPKSGTSRSGLRGFFTSN